MEVAETPDSRMLGGLCNNSCNDRTSKQSTNSSAPGHRDAKIPFGNINTAATASPGILMSRLTTHSGQDQGCGRVHFVVTTNYLLQTRDHVV